VFDVGMNNGSDTAYYLHRGYRVVAIDADPTLCQAAEDRFATEVASGLLVIRNVGVADSEGELEFWVSDRTEWSSFSRENATKGGTAARSISVSTLPFKRLIEDHGVPDYLKIDIEGNDRLCLQGLSGCELPPFVSVEMCHEDGGTDIDILADLGYTGFRCVRQNDFRDILPENIDRQAVIRRVLARLGPTSELVLRRLQPTVKVGGWRFRRGTSGPLPGEVPGRWITCAEVKSLWQRLRDLDSELGDEGIGEWFDIHARLTAS
jgi:FkbM family methyltransferase